MCPARITNVRLEHGGKYTCGPTTGISDTVMVHVIAGKYIVIVVIYNIYLGNELIRSSLYLLLLILDNIFSSDRVSVYYSE